MRAYAILLVVIRHAHYCLPISISDYPWWLKGTWSGVDLFFVVSGYVITQSLLPQVQLLESGKLSLHAFLISFYIRRITRLLPVCWLWLCLSLFCSVFFNTSGQFGNLSSLWYEALAIVLYVYNFWVIWGGSSELGWHWSLSIEEQFYFLYPVFLFLTLKKQKLRLGFLFFYIILITLVVRPFFSQSYSGSLWPYFTASSHLRFDALAAGCILGHLGWKLKVNKVILWVCLLGLGSTGVWMPQPQYWSYPVIILFSVILVGVASQDAQRLPFSSHPLLIWLGGRSYSLYLIHIPAMRFSNECIMRIWGYSEGEVPWFLAVVWLMISLLLSVLLAELSYRLVESPSTQLGKDMSQKLFEKR